MHSYPEDFYEKLEFDKILSRLSVYCFGEPAKQLIEAIRPYDNRKKIERMLDEIQEFRKCIDLGYEFPISHYSSILDEISLLRKIDYVLDLDQYIKIYIHLRMVSEIVKFFKENDRAEHLPLLFAISEQIELDKAVIDSFERIFTEEGKIKASASPELNLILKAINSKERDLNKQFSHILEKYKKLGYLTDNFESVKNGRRVLSVSAEFKRKIKGIIHDESATGKTVFIEPEDIMDISNELFELEADKRLEIYKILKLLSAQLRPYLDSFALWQKILVRYDIIRSKALFAQSYSGKKPKISEKTEFQIKKAYHPLLFLINNEQSKETISFDLSLSSQKRILIISGPNAGGKSVTLKAIGLNQLMLQSGLLVAAEEDSSFAIFQKIMMDIGDQQSLEGDLSTYSSRLMHMKHFVTESNRKSLILIDEFGSGSDPKMGGAIAEGILDTLIKKKCFGVITTHYSNIKNYAYRSENILNGAMLFDNEALKPTYKLKLGQPGSSFAFELARQIGMQEEVLEYARKKAGKDSETIDKLLIDLQSEKKGLDEEIKNSSDKSQQLTKLIESYELMKDDLEIRRKKLKKEAKEKSYLNLSDSEKEIQKMIQELKKEKKEESLKNLSKKLKTFKTEAREEIKDLSKDIFKEEIEKVKDLKVGQYVRLRSGGDAGKVISFDEKKVKIEMGILNLEVPRSEIVFAGSPLIGKSLSINTDTINNPYSLETELDIRGYSMQEARDSIQEFLDNALMGSSTRLKILHGKGSGVLRKIVWQKAKEYKDIEKIWHPKEEFGGKGVSFISFSA